MNIDGFALELAALRQRFATLQQQQNFSSNATEAYQDIVVEDLLVVVEELQVAEEELRLQHEELNVSDFRLAVERQRYQELFDFAPDAYFVTDLDSKIQEANQAATRLLGVPSEALIGKPLAVFVPTAARSSFRSKLAQLKLAQQPQNWELQLQPRKGNLFDAALTVATVRDLQEQPIQVRWMLRDITQRKQMERELLRLNEQLVQRIAFEETLTSILEKLRSSLDETELLQTAVQELTLSLRLLGCSAATYDTAGTVSNVCCRYTIPGATEIDSQKRTSWMADLPEVYNQLQQRQHFQFCILPDRPTETSSSLLVCPIVDHHDVLGDLWCFSQPETVLDENQVYLVRQVANQCAIALRQARLYQATQAQVAELKNLNRLKDDFMSTVSHELRTPLTNIKMAIYLMKGDLSPEQRDRYLQILEAECQQEINLVTDLLDLQRIETEQYPVFVTEAIVLSDWLNTILAAFLERIQTRQQTFKLNLSLPLSTIYTDAGNLRRVLLELLQNAHKYSPVGGEISLNVEYDAEATEVIFTITNQAEISAIHLPRIFEKFYRIPQENSWQVGGTGLGLALVKRLVEHMQGRISVRSSEGWTSFSLALPDLRASLPHDR
jgi:PAS domain S-box-containing protein